MAKWQFFQNLYQESLLLLKIVKIFAGVFSQGNCIKRCVKKQWFCIKLWLYLKNHSFLAKAPGRHGIGLSKKDCGNISNTYITLHKIVFRVPKITRTARTLYVIKGVIWEYSYFMKDDLPSPKHTCILIATQLVPLLQHIYNHGYY